MYDLKAVNISSILLGTPCWYLFGEPVAFINPIHYY